MTVRKTFGVFALLICILLMVPAQAAEQVKPLFTFGVIADIQYADVADSGSRYYRAAFGKLDDCVKDLNGNKAAFVVQLGDFIDRDFASFNAVLLRYNMLHTRHYHVLGNHDAACVENESEVFKKLGLEKGYYDFTQGSWRFIVLDGNDLRLNSSKVTDAAKLAESQAMFQSLKDRNAPNAQTWNGGAGKEQLLWLKSKLEAATQANEKVVIFCHFPVLPAAGDNLWNDKEMVRTIEPYKCVKAWINGHNHAGNYVLKDGIHYLTQQGMLDTPNTTAYSKIEVYPDRLNVIGTGRVQSKTLTLR